MYQALEKSRRRNCRSDLGSVLRYAGRTVRTRGGLFHYPCRYLTAPPARRTETRDRNRFARRVDSCKMDEHQQTGKLLYTHFEDICKLLKNTTSLSRSAMDCVREALPMQTTQPSSESWKYSENWLKSHGNTTYRSLSKGRDTFRCKKIRENMDKQIKYCHGPRSTRWDRWSATSEPDTTTLPPRSARR